MSAPQFNQVAYGLTQGLIGIFPAPIVSKRAPTVNDRKVIGTTWVNTLTDFYYVLTAIRGNQANWEIVSGGAGGVVQFTTDAGVVLPAAGNINVVGGGTTNITTSGAGSTITVAVIPSPSFAGTTTVATGLVATAGNIIASAGNISATAGSVSAGTSVAAGTTVTAGTGITATTGNIVATAGAVSANTTVTAGTNLVGTTGLSVAAFGFGSIISNGTGVFSSINGTDGQVLIAATGAAPAWASITAGANITITPGPNTLTIASGTGAATLDYISTAASPYVAAADDYYISSDATAGARTIQLPDAPAVGRAFVVKDQVGISGTNNITITTVGGVVLIDGATTYVLNTNYQSAQFIFNGTSYEVY